MRSAWAGPAGAATATVAPGRRRGGYSSVDQISEWLIAFVSEQNNPLGLGVLAASALVEYVFPPFPGDTVTLFGAVLITSHGWSFTGVFGAVMAGSGLGSMLAFFFGRGWQRRRELGAARGKRQRAALNRLVARFERHGPAYLVVNRFLPGFRALFFVAAGMANMPPRPVLAYSLVSAALWNLGLIGLGSLVGDNLEELVALVRQYTVGAWVVVGAIAVALVARSLWRRRRASATDDQEAAADR